MKLYYIAKSDIIETKKVQLQNYPQQTLEFKKGLFLFNSPHDHFKYSNKNNIETYYDGDIITLDKDLIFTSERKANVIFLRLKIEEMETNGSNLFLCKTYNKLKDELSDIYSNYPEYLI